MLRFQYHHLREEWANDFLVAYFCSHNPECDAGLAASASIGDLRTAAWIVIEMLGNTEKDRETRAFAKSFRRDSPPPASYPADFDPYLGWTYGKLLAMSVQRYLGYGHQLAGTLAARWVRDSTCY